jgi:hypothetical protein
VEAVGARPPSTVTDGVLAGAEEEAEADEGPCPSDCLRGIKLDEY